MLEQLTIVKNPELAKSEDYLFLKVKGLEHIEKLAHKLWTDYNIHDPGITFLEALCYAVTDLGYRTNYDIKDLLTREINGMPFIDKNFYTALQIFPNTPVTFNDLRKLLIDIEGVRNAWISKNNKIVYCLDTLEEKLKDCEGLPADQPLSPLNGIYDVLIEYEDYISEKERIIVAGKKNKDLGSYMLPESKGINFRVFHPLTLRSVSVYAETAPEDLTIRLLEGDESDNYTVLQQVTKTVADADTLTEIELNFNIKTGKKYRLDAGGSTAKLFADDAHTYPDEKHLLIALQSGWDGAATDSLYYFFYNWKITYAVSPVELEWAVSEDLIRNTTGMDDAPPVDGAYINVADKGLTFDVISPVFLDAVYMLPETDGSVKIHILDKNDLEIHASEPVNVKAGELNRIAVEIELLPGYNYKINAQGSSVKLFRNTNASFPFEIENVLEIKGGNPTESHYFFFYKWEVRYRYPAVQVAELTRADIRLAIEDRLFSNRSLSEDLCGVHDLDHEKIAVCADIELSPEADINATLAEIFYQLELHVSPPVNFYSIQELRDKGFTTDQIFEGPVLDHGFIDDDEFRKIERREDIRTSDVIQILMDIPGVKAIKEIKLLSFTEVSPENPVQPGDKTAVIDGIKYIVKEDDWLLTLEDPGKMAPDFDPDFSKIIFYKNGLPYYANQAQVMELYNEKRFRSTGGKLKGHEKDLAIPLGEDKALEDYYPVQHELPANYRVGKYRVPESETSLRKAQSRQLKGYLLFFEQILANYLSQLTHVKDLFSWKEHSLKTYFTQAVFDFASAEDLYLLDADDHIISLNEMVEDEETAIDRKNRFLDHLMGRFAENMDEYSALMKNLYKDTAPKKLIEDKKRFLSHYAKIGSERGKAFDYRYPKDPDNLSGLARRVSCLLGFETIERRVLASNRIKKVFLELGEGECAPETWRFEITNEAGDAVVFTSICCQHEHLICGLIDSVIEIGANEDNYQLNETDGHWELVQHCNDEDALIGKLSSDDEAIKNELLAFFQSLHATEGLHVIEHILLRKRTTDDAFLPVQLNEHASDCDCPEVDDPYSFRISVILPSWAERFRNVRFRQLVEKTIRMETPAHIYPRICWVNHCEMQELDECHENWLEQLSKVATGYRGCFPLPDTEAPELPVDEKEMLTSYREAQQALIDKLYNLTNVFPTARLHDCEEVDSDNPQITLNDTNLGTL